MCFLLCVCIFAGGRPLIQRKTVEQEKDGQNNGNEVFQNQIFSPTEMRMRMINELQKREEIFSCELELQQLEQSHAMKAASQAMQQYVMQNEVEEREHEHFQCLALANIHSCYFSYYLSTQSHLRTITQSLIRFAQFFVPSISFITITSLYSPFSPSSSSFYTPSSSSSSRSWTASSADLVMTLSCSSKHTSSH